MRAALVSFSIFPLLLASVGLQAQDARPIADGARIRVTAPSLGIEKLNGMWLAEERDTVRILAEPDGEILAIPRRSVSRLDAYRGRRSNTMNGVGIGVLGGGLLLGTLAAVTFEEPPLCDWFCLDIGPRDSTEAFWWGFAGGAALGAVTGAVIGALIETDRWERVMPRSLDLNALATPAGQFGLSASLTF